MKNKLKILFFILIVSFTLLSCSEIVNEPILEAPIIKNDNKIVTWNMIDEATSYEVYINDLLIEELQITKYIVDNDKDCYIYIKAKNNKETSPRSNTIYLYNEVEAVKEEVLYTYLESGSFNYDGSINENILFGQENLLKDTNLWRLLEEIFKNHKDDNGGYSAEFWGKLLRGACLTYNYTCDLELYEIMEETVTNIIEIQNNEIDGRLSGFSVEQEFHGWDLRSRSYNLLGLEYFYQICKDESLKEKVLLSLTKQTDYIMKYIGKGKIEILETSPDWGGATSANMLEGVTRLYGLTKEERFKEFAKYIIDTGGSTMLSQNGKTIVEDAILRTPMYLWGCRKFYEVANFMEGVLQYYLLTGDEEAKEIALGFYEVVDKSEITEDGGVAIDVEEACNSVIEQADPTRLGRMQETCAGVVWVKFCAHLFMITHDIKIMDNIEKAYYNYLQGIMDYDLYHDFPYFSYSPVGCTSRVDVYSGTAFLSETVIQSCCVISGASAMPTVSEVSVTKMEDGISYNLYFDGEVTTTIENEEVKFICETKYPEDGKIRIYLSMINDVNFKLNLRIPAYSKKTMVSLNGIEIEDIKEEEYLTLSRKWQNGDYIDLEFDMRAYLIYGSEECSNENGKYNVVVKRGPVVFSRDYRIEKQQMFEAVSFIEEDGYLIADVVNDINFKHQVAIKVKTQNGFITLVDYGSAGKTESDDSTMCLWIPTKDYWSQDYTKDIVPIVFYDDSLIKWENGKLVIEQSVADLTSKKIFDIFAWRLEEVDDNTYRIYQVSSGSYLTLALNGYTISLLKEKTNDGSQYFTLKEVGLNRFKIIASNNKLITVHGETKEIYLLEDISHELQYWYFKNYQK